MPLMVMTTIIGSMAVTTVLLSSVDSKRTMSLALSTEHRVMIPALVLSIMVMAVAISMESVVH